VHLGAAGAGGQLDVPALVLAARAPAHRDGGAGEITALGVDVHGLELDRLAHLDGSHALDPGEVGQGAPSRHVVLALDLGLPRRSHAPILPRTGASSRAAIARPPPDDRRAFRPSSPSADVGRSTYR
jgi:hypothetical protein